MKRFVLIFISSCAMLIAFAQEEIIFDSIQINHTAPDANTLNTIRPLLSEDTFPAEKLNLMNQSFGYQPGLPDYNKSLNLSKSFNSPLIYSESFSMFGYGISPFYTNGVVFNHAAYRLNDRFILGGNSVGAMTVFDQPQINPSMQNTAGALKIRTYYRINYTVVL